VQRGYRHPIYQRGNSQARHSINRRDSGQGANMITLARIYKPAVASNYSTISALCAVIDRVANRF